jgi:hypothetical protein
MIWMQLTIIYKNTWKPIYENNYQNMGGKPDNLNECV